MALTPGTRLGVYEVTAQIGEGGMGQVFRARDTKLNRDVALKILPEAFASDPERLARFTREAQTLASLNHPNIAHIHGLEESGGVRALVMELVEGDDLSQRIARGAIPLDEALPIAKQIAEALEAAHEQGIIHRDLKPANIKVRADGTVKVLDFGLAKALAPEPGSAAAVHLSQSPTITSPAMMTGVGMILGTAAYMAPEQARGKAVDRRADIWAFGCVLYEMLTGKRAFPGDDVTDTIVSVLSKEPDWSALPSLTPAFVRSLLRRCLDKDSKRRLRDIGEARLAFDGALETTAPQTAPTPALLSSAGAAWIVAGLSLVVAGVLAVPTFLSIRQAAPESVVRRLDVVTPPTSDPFSFALSPDGRFLVFTATSEDRPYLWLRPLDQASARPLQGTAGGTSPFWAPDNRAIAFFADGKLKRLELEGGVPQVIADAPDARGGSWSTAGFILFTPSFAGGVVRVPASGGTAEVVLSPELPKYGSYRFPQVLPDGRHFIFFANLGTDPSAVLLGSLDGTTPKRLALADTAAAFAPPDYVMRVNQGVLEAQRLDLARGLLSDPMPVAQPVGADPTVFRGAFAVSSTGVLAHRLTTAARRQLLWFDRTGARLEAVGAPNEHSQLHPALAPDGVRVAVQRTPTGVPHTFLLDGRPEETAVRLMNDPSPEGRPVWSPDGRSLVVLQGRIGLGLTIKSLDDEIERSLFASPQAVNPTDWSVDGRFILYGRADAKAGWDLWAVPSTGDAKPFPVVQAPADQAQGVFSPNLRWVAYDSNDSGRYEVYVQPFQRSGARVIFSAGGGMFPRWRGDGRELFYIAVDGTLMAVQVRESANGETLEPSVPAPLFRVRIAGGGAPLPGGTYQYTVARDGKRFLVNVTTDEATASPITIVLNWTAGLKR